MEESPGDRKNTREGDFALWGSRFEGPLAEEAAALNRSLPVDRRLWREELDVDEAWSEALVTAGVLAPDEGARIVEGLARLRERFAGAGTTGALDEDIHTLVERLLLEEIGPVAGKLRTGRSRNDLVATVSRLWTCRAARDLARATARVQAALLRQAESSVDVLLPTYTHLQRAQPTRLAQFFLSHFWAFERDRRRWTGVDERASVLPLGAGAAAGSAFEIDRESLRARLGFESLAANSIDAVADRDFVAEFAFAGALAGVHLSRLGEDLIIYASAEFGFLRFADAYSTGSSLMPHKRNPDIAELARGKSARLSGQAIAALTLLKALPSAYNKDLQEDKPILFDVYDTLRLVLPGMAGAVETLETRPDATRAALEPAMLAADVADALVRGGLSFREAHEVVGALVREAESHGLSIAETSAEAAAEIHPSLPHAVEQVLGGFDRDDEGPEDAYERSVESRRAAGGSARESVTEQIAAARSVLS